MVEFQRSVVPRVPGEFANSIFEGIWGRFWLMEQVYGEGWFLLVNWVLFCVPVVLFYSIVVPEFGGIDHLPDELTARICG